MDVLLLTIPDDLIVTLTKVGFFTKKFKNLANTKLTKYNNKDLELKFLEYSSQ